MMDPSKIAQAFNLSFYNDDGTSKKGQVSLSFWKLRADGKHERRRFSEIILNQGDPIANLSKEDGKSYFTGLFTEIHLRTNGYTVRVKSQGIHLTPKTTIRDLWELAKKKAKEQQAAASPSISKPKPAAPKQEVPVKDETAIERVKETLTVPVFESTEELYRYLRTGGSRDNPKIAQDIEGHYYLCASSTVYKCEMVEGEFTVTNVDKNRVLATNEVWYKIAKKHIFDCFLTTL